MKPVLLTTTFPSLLGVRALLGPSALAQDPAVSVWIPTLFEELAGGPPNMTLEPGLGLCVCDCVHKLSLFLCEKAG